MPVQIGVSISIGFSVLLAIAGGAFLLYGLNKIHYEHVRWVHHLLLKIRYPVNPLEGKTIPEEINRKSARNVGVFLLSIAGCIILLCNSPKETPSTGSGHVVGLPSSEKCCSPSNPAVDPDDQPIIDTAAESVKLPEGKDIVAIRDSAFQRQVENPNLFKAKLQEILKNQGIDANLLASYGITLKNMIIPYCACYQKQGHDSGYILVFKVVYDFSSIDNILIPVPPASVVPIAAEPAPGEPRLFSHSGFPNGEYELNDYQKLKIGQLARSVIDEVVENKQPKTITCKGFTDANPFGGADSYSDQACIQDICQPVLWGEPCGVGRSLRSIGIGNNNTLSFARGYAGIAFFVEMIRLHDPSGKTTKLLKFEYTGCGVGSERGGDHENRRIIFEIK